MVARCSSRLAGELEIRPLELPDSPEERLWRAWAELTYLDSVEGYGDFGPPPSPEEMLTRARATNTMRRWLAIRDGQPVGFGRLTIDPDLNPEGARAYVYVAPRHRGNGFGPRLADTVLGAVDEQIRCVDLELATPNPDDGDPLLHGPGGHGAVKADTPGVRLALARGFELGQVMVVNRFDLADTAALAEALAGARQAAGTDYEVRGFAGEVPPELAAGIGNCKEQMFTDVPAGALEVPRPKIDAARVVELYGRLTATMELFVTVAVHRPTREVVALSELVHPAARPTASVAQYDTIVLRRHRGHRLGLLVKAANMLAARAALPQAPAVCTINAVENAPVLELNRALGFRVLSLQARLQLRVSPR